MKAVRKGHVKLKLYVLIFFDRILRSLRMSDAQPLCRAQARLNPVANRRIAGTLGARLDFERCGSDTA